MASKICILDDDAAFLQSLCSELVGGYEVVAVDSITQFRQKIASDRFDLIVVDMRLEAGKEGLDVLREINRADPFQPVVVATAYADTETYLEALQAGALLYVDKSRHSSSALALLFDAVIQQGRLRKDQAAALRELRRMDPIEIMGTSEGIRGLRTDIDRLARREDTAVLISGEIGSGRELTARNLHGRRQGGFVRPLAVLLPQAIPIGDLQRMLLGCYVGGVRRRGLLEDAHGSGLVVRNANRLPSEILALIVEAWEQHQFCPVGTNVQQSLESSLYFVCEDLAPVEAALVGHRSSIIRVPPLRDRKEDIALLATYLLDRMRHGGQERPLTLSPEATDAFLGHDWPGNVAELRATLEYASLKAIVERQTFISVRHLPEIYGQTASSRSHSSQFRWDLEYQEARTQVALVESAIRELATRNKTRLAVFLGVRTPTTLTRRIERCLRRYPDLAFEFIHTADAFLEKASISLPATKP